MFAFGVVWLTTNALSSLLRMVNTGGVPEGVVLRQPA
jgi:hypothetical protein